MAIHPVYKDKLPRNRVSTKDPIVNGCVSTKFFDKFKSKYPKYADQDNELLKNIICTDNKKTWEAVVKNRDGVELRSSLGYVFIGSCKITKRSMIDMKRTLETGKKVLFRNLETDGYVAKIFYTNFNTKYSLKNRELWSFKGTQEFRKILSETYKKEWRKYINVTTHLNVRTLYSKLNKKKSVSDFMKKKSKKELVNYNEFKLD